MIRILLSAWITVVSGSVAWASDWPASIFDGADPRELAEIAAHPNLAQDAYTHLQPCPVPDENGMCNKNQRDFTLDWIYAFYNDPNAARNLAFWLSDEGGPPQNTDPTSTDELGIVPNPMWGCAWSIAVITAGGTEFMNDDLQNYKDHCENGLSDENQSEANDVAYSVLEKIQDNRKAGSAPIDLLN